MITWAVEEATSELLAGEAPDGLLCRAELALLSSLHGSQQRADWLLGRSVVKKLCRAELQRHGVLVPLSALAVVAAPDGTPVVMGPRGRLPLTVSISHRAGLAAAAMCEGGDAPLGVHVELVEPRARRLVQEYYTPAEAASAARAAPWERMRVETEIWALKQATLRAQRQGGSVHPGAVEVRAREEPRPGWAPARILGRDPARAFVRDLGGYVLALVWLGREDLADPLEELELHWPSFASARVSGDTRARSGGRAFPAQGVDPQTTP